MSLDKVLSKHDQTIILAFDIGFRFDFETCEMVRPSGHRRKIDKVYGKQRYPYDGFSLNGKSLSFTVHRFCAYQKFGYDLFSDGVVVRHLDDNPLNLSWENIELGSQKDNSLDQCEIERKNRAIYARSFQKRPSQCDTSDLVVESILKEFFEKTKGLERTPWGLNTHLSDKYGKSKSAIESIVYGKSFKDIYSKVYKEFYNV